MTGTSRDIELYPLNIKENNCQKIGELSTVIKKFNNKSLKQYIWLIHVKNLNIEKKI